MNNVLKIVIGAVSAVALMILASMAMGVNDGGYRTVVQYPTGQMSVKFTEGWYFAGFGKTTEYPNYITMDFDKTVNSESASLDQNGIAVRYQDGGTGTIYGVAQFELPQDEQSMIALHRKYRTVQGVSHKLIKSITEASANSTAGLLTSEEAYAEKRNTFTQWTRLQLSQGKFRTVSKSIITTDEATGKQITKNVPSISVDKETGEIQHSESTLRDNSITISSFEVTDWSFEQKTLAQIAAKREATMGIITAKAQAEQAKQEALTIEEKGKAEVMRSKYVREVEKEAAIVEAEQKKEVAVIQAEQLVSVAEQAKLQALVKAQQLVAVAEQARLEAEQKKFTAEEFKQEQILIGEGESERKRLVLEADGALEQKIGAYVEIQKAYAAAIGQQKWVPETQIGTSGSTDGNAANDLLQLFLAKSAKDLTLDMSIKK